MDGLIKIIGGEVTALCLGTVVAAVLILAKWYFDTRQSKWLPGPVGLPVLGNLLQFDASKPFLAFTDWKQRYGDIIGIKALGNNIVVLNSLQSISEFLDKRGANYSHRPVFTVVGELMGLDNSMPLMPYGPDWRRSRKLAHHALSPAAVTRYYRLQEDIASILAAEVADDPISFYEYIRLAASRIIIVITYGISIETADSEYISHADATMKMISESTVPGAYMCDLLPAMKYLPSFLPFHRQAVKGKGMIDRLVTMPFERVKADMMLHAARPSLTEHLLSQYNEDSSEGLSPAEYEKLVKWTTGSMYGAGGETTYSTVLNFVAAMALHPDVQKRAHDELISVVGQHNLPTMSDRPAFPYFTAVIKETMRWSPALPLGIARRSDKDDHYLGCVIPGDSIVMPNVWSIAFLPDDKYDPEAFIPDRFLDPESSAVDPAQWAFGFGRRICPGKHLGENSVFIITATLLAVFEISEDPEEKLVPRYENHLIRYPKPFKCQMIPRSSTVLDTARRRAAQSDT